MLKNMYPFVRYTMVPWCKEGLCAGETPCFTYSFLLWLILQPSNPTPSPQETEEEKQFRALFEQISGKVSAKSLCVMTTDRKEERVLLPPRAKRGKNCVLGAVCLAVVCHLGTRCHHALYLDEEGHSSYWATGGSGLELKSLGSLYGSVSSCIFLPLNQWFHLKIACRQPHTQ